MVGKAAVVVGVGVVLLVLSVSVLVLEGWRKEWPVVYLFC